MKLVPLTFILLLCLTLLPALNHAQEAAPLKLEQIEQLLNISWDDAVIARELLKRGITFRVDDKALERLAKKKLGSQTREALLQLETRAAYQDLQNTKDAAARLAQTQQFLRLYPQSEHALKVREMARLAELEIFDAAYRAYLTSYDLPKLNALFTRSDELRQRDNHPLVSLQTTTRLAIATGRGLFHNAYTDFERSRQLASEAFQLLEPASPTINVDKEFYRQFRAENFPALCQLRAYFLLRQTPPDTEAALRWLAIATTDEAPTAKDPLTYWLRAWVNREAHQKLRMEITTFNAETRAGTAGQIACQHYGTLTSHLIEDYTKVVEFSASNDARALREEAVTAVKALSQQPNPCTVPLQPTAQRARRVPANDTRRTLFIRSKTVYLKPAQMETTLLADAEFQALGWRVVRNEKEADVIAEITLPFLTWQWTLELLHQPTSTLLGTSQVRETTARNAIPKLAAQLVATLQQAKL